MPSKGSRAASRQAQLKRKKRRGKGQPEVFAAGPIARPASAEEESSTDSVPQTQAAPLSAQPAPQPVRRSRQRGASGESQRRDLQHLRCRLGSGHPESGLRRL